MVDGRPARVVGNKVFPNGFLEYEMRVETMKPLEVLVLFHASGGALRAIINGCPHTIHPEAANRFTRRGVVVESTPHSTITVRIEKEGSSYPVLGGIGIRIQSQE